MTTLSQASIATVVKDGFFKHVYFFDEISSTNDFAHTIAVEEANNGTLVITEFQSAGRGRKQRAWDAAMGKNLLMSLLVRPGHLAATEVYQLVMVAGLSIAYAVNQVSDCKVEVKWPNDLQINNKKFCGLLPESSLSGERIDYAVIGMGINVNQVEWGDPEIAQVATSPAKETGKELDRLKLLRAISELFGQYYTQLGSNQLVEAWQHASSTLGKEVVVQQPNGVQVAGTAAAIDSIGTLIVNTAQGRVPVSFGEASLRYQPD